MTAHVKLTLEGIAGPRLSAMSAATTYTLTGPTTVFNGVPATYTLTPNGTTTAVVTPAIATLTGTFSPTTVTLNGTTPVTFTFTPSSTGTGTLSVTNNGGLTDPSSLTLTSITAPLTTFKSWGSIYTKSGIHPWGQWYTL